MVRPAQLSTSTLSTGSTSSAAVSLRDAALQAHRPVPGGEGTKTPYDLDAASAGSMRRFLSFWGQTDASRMFPIPAKGQPTLRVATYEYHSGLPMEGWLDAVPANKKLQMSALTCVSAHGGLDFEKFARENKYQLRVSGPDGKVQVERRFGPGYSNGAVKEYASESPAFEIDISKPGNYVIDCAPDGSGGVGGYVEARRLILHITGKEPLQPAPVAAKE